MKKIIVFILLSFSVFGLASCGNTTPAKSNFARVYHFNGESEQLRILNGSIVIDKEEKLDGGDLEIINQELFTDITSYYTTYYLMQGKEKTVILSNAVEDLTGDSVEPDKDLGEISGGDLFYGNTAEFIESNLWFELKTVGRNGEENSYQVQLNVTQN